MKKPRRWEQDPKDWGLGDCPPKQSCVICEKIGNDKAKMRHLRDLFLEGVPGWLLCRAYGLLPIRAAWGTHFYNHANYHNWYRVRKPAGVYRLPIKKIAILIALTRLKESWHLYSKNTPDKMIKILADLEIAGLAEEEKGDDENHSHED